MTLDRDLDKRLAGRLTLSAPASCRTAMGVGLVLFATAIGGCTSPSADATSTANRSSRQSARQPSSHVPSTGPPADPVGGEQIHGAAVEYSQTRGSALPSAAFAARLATLHASLENYVDRGNLTDSLYYGWADAPMDRARLAMVIKINILLSHEKMLREMADARLTRGKEEALLTWAQRALADIQRDALARLRDAQANPRGEGEPSRPAVHVMDEATISRQHEVLGDGMLLASMGLQDWAPASASSESQPHSAEAPRRLTLKSLLRGDSPERRQGLAEIVVAAQEPWPAMLARLSLLRFHASMLRRTTPSVSLNVFTIKLRLGGSAAGAPADFGVQAMRALPTLWTSALRECGPIVVEGWRDPFEDSRDGDSLMLAPASVMALSRASRDLGILDVYLRSKGPSGGPRASGRPVLRGAKLDMALVLGDDASQGDDAWADWALRLFSELAKRQIRFAVFRGVMASPLPQYRAERMDRTQLKSFVRRIRQELALANGAEGRLTARDDNGRIAANVWIEHGTMGQSEDASAPAPHWVVVANLSAEQRSLRLRGGEPIGTCVDVIRGEPVPSAAEAMAFAPGQVRFLVQTAE